MRESAGLSVLSGETMPIAYVVFAEEDKDFVQSRLIRALPVLGFDRWLSNYSLSPDAPQIKTALSACSALLIVISKGAAESESLRRHLVEVLSAGVHPVPVQVDHTPPATVAEQLD